MTDYREVKKLRSKTQKVKKEMHAQTTGQQLYASQLESRDAHELQETFQRLLSSNAPSSPEQQQIADSIKVLLGQFVKKLNYSKTPNKQRVIPDEVKKFLTAASEGDTEACRVSLSARVDVNSKGYAGETAFHVAALNGRSELIKLLRHSKADVNAQDDRGDTPLMKAAREKQGQFAQVLLQYYQGEATLDTRNLKGQSAFDIAFKKCDEKILRLLLEQNIEFSCDQQQRNESLLFKFAEEGKVSMIRLWFDNHKCVTRNCIRNEKSQTLVSVAADKGHVEIVDYFNKKGVNLDVADCDGNTPLFCAARGGFESIAKLLISKGCQVNHVNRYGRTAIFEAVLNGHFGITELLRNSGAELNVKDNDGATLLSMSVQAGSKEIFDYLCDKLKDLDKLLLETTSSGDSLLLLSSKTPSFDIFETLVARGLDVNHKNQLGITPALRASVNGKMDMVRLLHEKGAEMDMKNIVNHTATLRAAQNNFKEMLKFFINECSCDIWVQNSHGYSIAYFAAKHNDEEILKLLIDKGAPLDLADSNGFTPVMIAASEGNLEALKVLTESEKVNLKRRTRQGWSLARIAADKGFVRATKYLCGNSECYMDESDNRGETALQAALSKEYVKTAKVLLQNACDPCPSDKDGMTCLHRAVNKDRNEIIVDLLRREADVDCADKNGFTPFLLAAAKQKETALSLLAAKNCGVNRRNNHGEGAAHLCLKGMIGWDAGSKKRLLKLLATLQALNCHMDSEDENGVTPLLLAVKQNQFEAFEFLAEQTPDLPDRENQKQSPTARRAELDLPDKQGVTACHLACEGDSIKVLRYLHQSKVKLNARDLKGQTPLMRACIHSCSQVIELLLQNYSRDDMNALDEDDKSALHFAIESNSWQAAKQLMDAGAELNRADKAGNTPCLLLAQRQQWNLLRTLEGKVEYKVVNCKLETFAHYAAAAKDGLSLLEDLKSRGVSLNSVTADGDSCLIIACSSGASQQTVELLLTEGNNLNHVNGKGQSAIFAAAIAPCYDLFRFLISKGSDLTQKDSGKNTPIHYLIENSGSDCLPILLEVVAGTTLNPLTELNSQGFNLCHMAAVKDHVDLVKTLLSQGWQVSQETPGKDTCVTLAARHSSEAVLSYLLSTTEHSLTNEELECVLRVSAEKGDPNLLSQLVNRVENVNAANVNGSTALHLACQKLRLDIEENPLCDSVAYQLEKSKASFVSFPSEFVQSSAIKCIKILLDSKADPSATDSRGCDCLQAAVEANSFDATRLLIDAKCPTDCQFVTCLSIAVKNGNREVINLLAERQAERQDRINLSQLANAKLMKKLLSNGKIGTIKWIFDQGVNFEREDPSLIFDVLDYGDSELLELFISNGLDIECKNAEGFTPFLRTLAIGREDLAGILLSKQCQTGARTKSGWDCVTVAVVQKRLFTVRWLFENLPNQLSVDACDADGMTALHFAAFKGHSGIFKLLCQQKYSPTKKCKKGWTPVEYAIANGHLAVVKALNSISRDAMLKAFERQDTDSALVEAAVRGCLNILEFWYTLGVNIENCQQPFLSACMSGQQHVVDWFISVGMDAAKCRDEKSGSTALLYSIESGNLHLAKFFVEYMRQDIKQVNLNGNGVVHSAVMTNQRRMLDYVINKGAAADAGDQQNDTPLLLAALKGHLDLLKLLLAYGCDIKKRNERGQTAVHMAVIGRDNVEMLRFLVSEEVQVPINSKDNKGNTPLMIACYQGHLEAAKFFLDADVKFGDCKNNDGSTPAILAAMNGRHEVLAMLAERGCKMNEPDKDGSTALMLAIQSESVEAIRVLREQNGTDESEMRDLEDRVRVNGGNLGHRIQLLEFGADNQTDEAACRIANHSSNEDADAAEDDESVNEADRSVVEGSAGAYMVEDENENDVSPTDQQVNTRVRTYTGTSQTSQSSLRQMSGPEQPDFDFGQQATPTELQSEANQQQQRH